MELLLTSIQNCFPDEASLDSFLVKHSLFFGGTFRLCRRRVSYEKNLSNFLKSLEGSSLGQLIEILKRKDGFIEPFERATTGEPDFSVSSYQEPRKGWWTDYRPTPRAEVVVVEPDWDDLSGKQLKMLRESIEKAFPNPKEFDMFLADTFNQRPLATHSAAGGFGQQLFDYLQEVQAKGQTRELVKELELTKRVSVRNLTEALGKV